MILFTGKWEIWKFTIQIELVAVPGYHLFQQLESGLDLIMGWLWNGMTWHGDAESHPLRLDGGEDLFEGVGRGLSFGFSSFQAVLKSEQGLSNGIGERNFAVVDQGDITNAPSHQAPTNSIVNSFEHKKNLVFSARSIF